MKKNQTTERQDLIKKVNDYLGSDYTKGEACCKELIESWIQAALKFRSSNPDACCLGTMKSLFHFFIEDSFDSKYVATKNAIFGDLFEIRSKGFENRYVSNIKLCRTYKAAYEKTELEYKKTFNKRRYSSYDSFRQIRSRKMKQKGLGLI